MVIYAEAYLHWKVSWVIRTSSFSEPTATQPLFFSGSCFCPILCVWTLSFLLMCASLALGISFPFTHIYFFTFLFLLLFSALFLSLCFPLSPILHCEAKVVRVLIVDLTSLYCTSQRSFRIFQ